MGIRNNRPLLYLVFALSQKACCADGLSHVDRSVQPDLSVLADESVARFFAVMATFKIRRDASDN